MEQNQTVEDNTFLFFRGAILDELRKDERLTDVVIVTNDGERFPCHKAILMAGCPFFKGLFTSDMVETRENEIKLEQIDISGLHFKLILEYIYTGKIMLNFETAKSINIHSLFFQMYHLKNITENILINLEEHATRLELWRHSKKYLNDKLKESCVQFILRSTETFFNTYVNDLTFEETKFIVSLKELKFKSRTLLENIVKWIKFDFENRQQYVKELMETINFDDIEDENFKKEIFSDDILTENKDFLQLAVKYFTRQCKPLVNVPIQELFVITKENIFYTDFDKKKFIKTILCPNIENFGISCHLTNGIIITGGWDEASSNLCKQFIPSTNCTCTCKCATNELPALLEARYDHRNYKIDGKVYVCGGVKNPSVEIFDESEKWINGPAMNKQRSEFGAAHDSYLRSPVHKKRHMSPSPLSPRRQPPSPISKRKRISPISHKRTSRDKSRVKRRRGATSSSGSEGSSDSSGSDSESSYSSSSSSSSHEKPPVKRNIRPTGASAVERKIAKKVEMAKKRSPISIEIKKTSSLGASALTAAVERENNSNSNSSTAAAAAANNKKTTRREELLKQLRAVEDAVARKKSKLN